MEVLHWLGKSSTRRVPVFQVEEPAREALPGLGLWDSTAFSHPPQPLPSSFPPPQPVFSASGPGNVLMPEKFFLLSAYVLLILHYQPCHSLGTAILCGPHSQYKTGPSVINSHRAITSSRTCLSQRNNTP